ncbi:MAG: nitroreductase family protein [Myxococcota bacterium]|jgi:nitroreductase|nr:nitroreductase family protein [Myxococcota bacterium]
MNALQAIATRRSIRKFSDEQVSEETIRALLEAAMAAPSAGNQQPWVFVLVDRRPLLEEISQIHPFAGMAKSAAGAVVVCGDLERERYAGYWVQDCSAATQNLLLAAHALGLGAVWVGIYPSPDRVDSFRRLLCLPASIVPLALVPFGRPAENKAESGRFDELRIHRNTW